MSLMSTARTLAGLGAALFLAICGIGSARAGDGADAARERLEERVRSGPALADLVAFAYEANPAVAAARAGLAAARATTRVATAWPDTGIEGTWWPEKEGSGLPARWEVMLSQGVPLPGRTGAAGRAGRAEEDAAAIELDTAVRDVTRGVRESAHELAYLRRARELARANGELLARLRSQGAAAYAGGRTGLYDLLRAQSQHAQAGYDEALLADLERAELARLNALLSRPVDAPVGELRLAGPEPLAYGVEEVLAFAEGGLEEVRAAEAGVRRARAERSLARYESLPELMVAAGYEREEPLGEAEGMERYLFRLGLTLPIQPGKTAGRLAAARAGEERAEAMRRAAVDAARSEVREAWFRVGTAARLAELYRGQLVPEAGAAASRAEAWYRQGEGSYADLVEAQALLYGFQIALARAEADHGRALARLEALAGRVLTRREAGSAP